MIATRRGHDIHLPGFATAHSHAFQRGLRARTQRRTAVPGSFWSWRGLMYQLAERIDPDTLYKLSRLAYVELAMAGVTAVAEFHYLHHQSDGTPYDDRTLLADAVIRAARDTGLRITLLRVLYHRDGHERPAQGAQLRFSDPDVELGLSDVDALRKSYADDSAVHVGLAPHSIRAVPLPWVVEAARHAELHHLPMHMHVSEQRREVDECIAEHGKPPILTLADAGILGPRFVAVHATHLDDDEIRALGAARSFACICRTTERDLGDGLCRSADLASAGVLLCTGVDSHAISDPFEEARSIELDDRTRQESRHVAADAEELLVAATTNGYRAAGLDDDGDEVVLDARDPALAGVDDSNLDDAVVFAATPRAIRTVKVAGRPIVVDGHHPDLDAARADYETALAGLL